MSEALSDAMSNLRDHVPSMPSMKSIDTSVVTDHLPKSGKKRSMFAIVVGVVAAAGALVTLMRRRRNAAPPASIYTPPLPKP